MYAIASNSNNRMAVTSVASAKVPNAAINRSGPPAMTMVEHRKRWSRSHSPVNRTPPPRGTRRPTPMCPGKIRASPAQATLAALGVRASIGTGDLAGLNALGIEHHAMDPGAEHKAGADDGDRDAQGDQPAGAVEKYVNGNQRLILPKCLHHEYGRDRAGHLEPTKHRFHRREVARTPACSRPIQSSAVPR